MNVNAVETIILNRRVITPRLSGSAGAALQWGSSAASAPAHGSLCPVTQGLGSQTEARAELNAELSQELSSYPCQKFLISPRSLLPLCRVAILLLHSPAPHVILSPMFPHQGPLMEAAASVARLWEKSAANKAGWHYILTKHDACVRKDKN